MIRPHLFELLCLSGCWQLTQQISLHTNSTESAIFCRLMPRRFGQEQLNLPQIDGCPGQVCGVLFGKIPASLLAGADPCAAQDLADEIIDAAKTNPEIKEGAREKMIQAAKTVAGAEHNTPPDSQNGGKARKALNCLKKPKNSELDGIVIKQDPNATGDEFFDPKTKKTVKLGEDPRTKPRSGDRGGDGQGAKDPKSGDQDKKDDNKDGGKKENNPDQSGQSGEVTKTLTLEVEDDDNKPGGKDDQKQGGGDGGKDSKGNNSKENSKDDGKENKDDGKENKADGKDNKADGKENKADGKENKADGNDNKKQGDGGAGGDNGGGQGFKGIFIDAKTLKACNNPKIKFGGGINARKQDEFTFIPEDQKNFAHGEALDLSIITTSSCDKLLNCKLDQKKEVFDKCKKLAEAVGKSKRDGAGADNWNLGWICHQLQSSKPWSQEE
ncbi:hypothetical protein VP01_168g4 [Puccinia sorghi]|uniref:Uncharacterized protein n=1 Tax=Puccinia sorghi TaxID=27349 RepID=A0A0L6VHQ2_9BASI|nr:hypothetical protein VP01_168g4 [Puccinia sorghi]